jgi:hypothetical protein
VAVFVVSAALPLLLLAQLAPAFQLTYEPGKDAPALLQLTQSRAPSPEALQIDCARARQGRCSQRATVGPGPRFIQAGATRAEADAMDLPALRYSPGERWSYRFSLWLPEAAASALPLAILWQWKRFSGRPDAFLAQRGNALVLRVGPSASLTLLKPVPTNRWLDLEVRTHWSPSPNGWIEARVSTAGQPPVVRHYSGPTTRDSRPRAAYMKWGLYQPGTIDGASAVPVRSVWHDAIDITQLP